MFTIVVVTGCKSWGTAIWISFSKMPSKIHIMQIELNIEFTVDIRLWNCLYHSLFILATRIVTGCTAALSCGDKSLHKTTTAADATAAIQKRCSSVV